MRVGKFEIFLSYCWKDEELAVKIEKILKNSNTINLHRDKIDINTWGSIKEYMQAISQMDYTILLITDSYLKSSNCMYEVLEVMRDRRFTERIFPVVINSEIYNPVIRAEYVKYWQEEYDKLNDSLQGINVQNLGRLGEDLKRAQDISANIAEFLDKVSDMNNPENENVCAAIEEKLQEKKFISSLEKIELKQTKQSLFDVIGIEPQIGEQRATDFEINKFMIQSFYELNNIMEGLCKELENRYPHYQVIIGKNDSRTYFYQFYKDGKISRNLNIFLDQSFGQTNIGISTNPIYFGGTSKSWNGMYTAKERDGILYLSSEMLFTGSKEFMVIEDAVKDIWEKYITPYLR